MTDDFYEGIQDIGEKTNKGVKYVGEKAAEGVEWAGDKTGIPDLASTALDVGGPIAKGFQGLQTVYNAGSKSLQDSQMGKMLSEASLDKQAINWGAIGQKGLEQGAAVGASALIPMAVKGAANKYRDYKAQKNIERVKEKHPELVEDLQDEHFQTLKRFAPDVAQDPSATKSFMKRISRTGMAPHEFVDRLAQTQSTIDRHRIADDVSDAAQRGYHKERDLRQRERHHEDDKALDEERIDQRERHHEDKQEW